MKFRNTILGMAMLAATLGPLVLPAHATVSAAESGAAVPPPPQPYYHRHGQRITVMGPIHRTNGKWNKAASPWTDPAEAYITSPNDGQGIAVQDETSRTDTKTPQK